MQSLLLNFMSMICHQQKAWVKKTLVELNSICEVKFQMPVEVLTKTPNSKLIPKPSSQERQAEMRRAVIKMKKVIQQSMDSTSTTTVMSNRISWRKFYKIRISETLENPTDCAH